MQYRNYIPTDISCYRSSGIQRFYDQSSRLLHYLFRYNLNLILLPHFLADKNQFSELKLCPPTYRTTKQTHKQTRMSNWTETKSIPTIKEVSHQEIDLCGFSEGDLQVLRKKDPFMYHSIPLVTKAAITLQAEDNVKTISTHASSIVI